MNTFFALVVAEFYEAAPYYIITATADVATVDERLEQDAQLLGDRPLSTFRRITLPLAAPDWPPASPSPGRVPWAPSGRCSSSPTTRRAFPSTIDQTFIANGLDASLVFALLLIVAALPLPLIALLWSARARGTQTVPVPASLGL